jgi:hypothetical protein
VAWPQAVSRIANTIARLRMRIVGFMLLSFSK